MGNSDSHNLWERSMSLDPLIPEPEQEEVESPLLSEPQCSSSLGSSSMPEIIQCDHEFTREEGPGRPIQLVQARPDGSLLFQEDVLQQCFLCSDVRETPVCVVSIVGERRKGKSFLLNYLLRKLSNMDEWDRMSDSEPLRGFEWLPGTETMTKGVFIWSQPLFLETQEGKLAVFLVDTEGSLDLSREMELSVKLCALSVFLSSHVIFNVHADVKTTDLDYLELLHLVVQKGGAAFDLQHFQGLYFLVRDWTQTQECGQSGGSQHLERIIQCLENSGTNKQALGILKEKRPLCHLMPLPGHELLWSQQGTMREMDEEFQHCLKEFINHIGQVLQTTQSTMTGKTLEGKFKEMAHVILKSKYRISSPAELLHALYQKTLQKLKQEFTIFLSEQRSLMHDTTLEIKGNVEQKEKDLLDREVSPQDFQELSQFLSSEREKFLKENTPLIIKKAKEKFINFLNEQRSILHDSTLWIKRNVEQKEKDLLARVQGEVSQQVFQELSQFLSSEREKFLKEYTLLIFKKAKKDFTDFLKEQRSILHDSTLGIKGNVEQKEKDLLARVQGEVSQQDFQELSQFLSSEREKFLKEYTLLIFKKAKKDFTDFLKEQRSIMHDTTLGIKRNVEQKEKDLLARVQGEVSPRDSQELSQFLSSEREKFLKEYTLLIFKKAKEDFTNFLNEQRKIMHDTTLGIKGNVEQKEKDLLARVQGEVSQQDFQELSQFLSSEREKFLKEYTLLIIKKAKKEFINFLNEQRSIMHDTTLGIKGNVVQKEKELLARVQGEVSQQDFQELSQFLSSERQKFIIKRAKKEFTDFLNEQRSIMHDTTLGIKRNVEQKEKDLLARVRGEVSQQDFQELSQFLSSERQKFIIERAKKEFTNFLNEQVSVWVREKLGG
ncbi:guanylate-binding protein 6-like isoform X1 [Lepisosteus oculatus]|uniref:guanylate-binding protein 6-like isoform X1 n=1 Tax=Lepisosteus oculatus TaxID=7918 RepID=UPI0035F5113C